MPTVVNFDRVSKRYRLGAGQGSLREALSSLPKRLLRRGRPEEDGADSLWAVRDVSFDLEPGRVLGVIGRNGAGKTTLLKLLSRVVQPTSGRIDVDGRVSALIELGAGFHPDLTGRENIYLNGVILGMSRKEIGRKFDSIVAFAELERFIDTPVKRYSSGMYARLGFAVAAHSDPDLLLVDEVLAVGDGAFQRKCYDFIHSFVTGGNTAIFVSHSMYVMEQLCNRLIWLDSGSVVMAGEPGQVLPAYMDAMDQQMVDQRAVGEVGSGHLRLAPVSFADIDGNERDSFVPGDDIVVKLAYRTEVPIEKPHFCLGITGPEGGTPLFMASMLTDGSAPDVIEGDGVLECRFESVPLMPRVYDVWGEVYAADRTELLLNWQRLGTFRIASSTNGHCRQIGKGGIRHLRADASIRVSYSWEY